MGEAVKAVDMSFVRAEAQKMLVDAKAYGDLEKTVSVLEEFLDKTK